MKKKLGIIVVLSLVLVSFFIKEKATNKEKFLLLKTELKLTLSNSNKFTEKEKGKYYMNSEDYEAVIEVGTYDIFIKYTDKICLFVNKEIEPGPISIDCNQEFFLEFNQIDKFSFFEDGEEKDVDDIDSIIDDIKFIVKILEQ